MSNSLHFGLSAGSLTDLSANTYGLLVEPHGFPWSPEPQISAVTMPGRDGAHLYGTRFAGRRATIPIRVEGDSTADLKSKMDAVARKLNSANGNGWWKLDSLSDRMFYGRVAGAIEFVPAGPRMARATLQLLSPEAFLYDVTEVTQTETISGTPTTFDVKDGSAVVDGTAVACPVWTIHNTAGSTSGVITLESLTRGEVFTTNTGIPNAWYARIDAARLMLEWSPDGSTWVPWMTARGSSVDIPKLSPGVSNSLRITGLSGGTVAAVYRPRYL